MKFKPPGNESLMVGLTSGHTIVIEPKGTDVPPHFRKAAIAQGCMPVGVGAEELALTEEDKRSKLILDGIERLLDGGDESAFNGDGKPNLKKLNAVLGFQASREELDAAWAKIAPGLTGDNGAQGE